MLRVEDPGVLPLDRDQVISVWVEAGTVDRELVGDRDLAGVEVDRPGEARPEVDRVGAEQGVEGRVRLGNGVAQRALARKGSQTPSPGSPSEFTVKVAA